MKTKMNLKQVFEIAAKTGDFPHVQIEKPLKHFPSNKGQITQITQRGVAVDFGGKWHKFFHAKPKNDKRSNYMTELKPITNNEN